MNTEQPPPRPLGMVATLAAGALLILLSVLAVGAGLCSAAFGVMTLIEGADYLTTLVLTVSGLGLVFAVACAWAARVGWRWLLRRSPVVRKGAP